MMTLSKLSGPVETLHILFKIRQFFLFFSIKEQASDLLKQNCVQKWNSYSVTRHY